MRTDFEEFVKQTLAQRERPIPRKTIGDLEVRLDRGLSRRGHLRFAMAFATVVILVTAVQTAIVPQTFLFDGPSSSPFTVKDDAIAIRSPIGSSPHAPAPRPLLDYNNPRHREGYPDGPIINEFINTPFYGDERRFLTVFGEGDDRAAKTMSAEPGSRYVIAAYIHNGATASLGREGIAKGVGVSFYFDAATAEGRLVTGHIETDTAGSGDTAALNFGTKRFNLQYVPGSARLLTPNNIEKGERIDTVTVSSASVFVPVGDLPQGLTSAVVVLITVEAVQRGWSLVSEVRQLGEPEWQASAAVRNDDELEHRLTLTNWQPEEAEAPTLSFKFAGETKWVRDSLALHSGDAIADAYYAGNSEAERQHLLFAPGQQPVRLKSGLSLSITFRSKIASCISPGNLTHTTRLQRQFTLYSPPDQILDTVSGYLQCR